MKPLVVTPGEPAGIGPDVLLQQIVDQPARPIVAIADCQLLQARTQQLNLAIECIEVTDDFFDAPTFQTNQLPVLHTPVATDVVAGQLSVENAPYVIKTLDKAIALCLSGRASGLVTGPVHKGVINDSGLAFTGHTEYLRDESNTEEVVMMLATEGLRVALVTTHLPLKDVSAAITKDKISRVTKILHQTLQQDFGCNNPRILVTGLNPHAGEGGHLGHEEIDTIIPALNKLKDQGFATQGPFPADTLFQPHYLENADAVLAMYHDQGLPVLKYKGFGNAVNITLGLPFIRTSVDHGTALDLAGSGKADDGSMRVALEQAMIMATQRERYYA